MNNTAAPWASIGWEHNPRITGADEVAFAFGWHWRIWPESTAQPSWAGYVHDEQNRERYEAGGQAARAAGKPEITTREELIAALYRLAVPMAAPSDSRGRWYSPIDGLPTPFVPVTVLVMLRERTQHERDRRPFLTSGCFIGGGWTLRYYDSAHDPIPTQYQASVVVAWQYPTETPGDEHLKMIRDTLEAYAAEGLQAHEVLTTQIPYPEKGRFRT